MSDPKRARELTLHLGADSDRDLIGGLTCFLTSLGRGELSGTGCSGGYGFGWDYKIETRDVTHDQYFEEIEKWIAAQKPSSAAAD